MPAAAVIPAPVAYINVVAVKKLVVGFLGYIAVPVVFDNGVISDVVYPINLSGFGLIG